MKATLSLLFALGCLAAAPIQAAPVQSPIIGTWAVDVTKLPMPPEARPKSVTISFTEPALGKMAMQVEILGGDGSARRMGSAFAPDGSAVPIEGDKAEADTAAAKMPAPDVLVMALGKGGIPASTRIYTVAPDGKQMTETAVYFGEDGKPIMRTNAFTRVR